MEETSSKPKRRRRERGHLFVGVVLLGLGALLLADNLGFDLPFRLWEAWPLVIVAGGALQLLSPGDADARQGGLWILTSGVYCWISSWRLFGLHWGTAWPIVLIAQGVIIGAGGVFGQPRGGRAGEVDDAS